MEIEKNIFITDEHTFNNWGTFNIAANEKTYFAKWEQRGNRKKLETDAPSDIYNRVYEYLFG